MVTLVKSVVILEPISYLVTMLMKFQNLSYMARNVYIIYMARFLRVFEYFDELL